MKTVAITAAEPAGIGPDILAALAHARFSGVSLVAVGNAELLQARAEQIAKPIRVYPFGEGIVQAHRGDGTLAVIDVPLRVPVIAGQTDTLNVAHVLAQLDIAVQGCMQGVFDALVTGPVNKATICRAGIPFQGHTEYLASICKCDSVMLLETEKLRVALATTHIPLNAVSGQLSRTLLEKTIKILHDDMRSRLKISSPRIAVCGLNPHAGEQGYLGREEIEIIAPAIEQCAAEGVEVFGPVSADTAFTPKQIAQYDVNLAMYHDQGLAVIKYAGFGKIVNITLGLPFVRTSVDHGTALELAGSGHAEATSLQLAVNRAVELAT